MSEASSETALGLLELRRARRRRRLEDVHWVDALYQAYLSALLGTIAVVVASTFVGDERLDAAGVRHVIRDGPGVLGVVVALVLFVGLRSGARGGPLAMEAADVRHVLLAPVDRGLALRGPAWRQLRFALFVGAIAGAVGGELAARRLPKPGVLWVLCGGAFGVVTLAVALGAALVVSGRRIPSAYASVAGLLLVGWSVADAAGAAPASPVSSIGKIALWPLHFDPVGLIPIAAAAALVVLGFGALPGLSLESAERRSRLVGQLRFAATLQDLRTVIVLRRQLAQELPRLRPWIRLRGRRSPNVWRRGWQGILRWPAARIARVVVLSAAAGLAMRGVWDGTTPLIVVAGLALFVAGLDAIEPLAQETDHPGRRDSYPVDEGTLHLKHLPAAGVVCFLVALIAAATGVLVDPSAGALQVAAISLLPAALGACGGATTSVVMGAPAQTDTALFLPPEVTGMRIAGRTVWPPLLATLGCAPVLAARAAADAGQPAVRGAAAAAFPMILVFAMVCAWVRFREQAKAWWRSQMENAFPARQPEQREAGNG